MQHSELRVLVKVLGVIAFLFAALCAAAGLPFGNWEAWLAGGFGLWLLASI